MCRSFRFILGLVVCLCVSTFAATYGGGSGTAGDPYRITTPAHWQTLMSASADWGKCFILKSDINLSGVTIAPVGDDTTNFTGTFDGDGHVIGNLSYSNTSAAWVGLFGNTGIAAVIKNLGVQNAAISVSGVAGALIGANDGTIESCWATGSVSGEYDLGGLAGRNVGIIRFCHTAVSVTATGNTAGGLVGYNPGVINDCYAMGAVSGNNYVGGLVGFHDGTQISNCFAAGTVIGNTNVGALVGYLYSPITASFWDIETSGMTDGIGSQEPDPSGAAGKTTAQMQTLSTFTDAGWDFSDMDGDAADWKIQPVAYPRLAWEPHSGGDGTSANPYQIATVADWQMLMSRSADWGKCFILINPIDLYGFTVTPVGNNTTKFTGVFNGNRHTISHVVINTPGSDYVGLFGEIGSGGQVKNLGLETVTITGRNAVGGLVGYSHEGTITNCYVKNGSVLGGGSVGGLAGSAGLGILTFCYAACDVTGTSDVGGLVGANDYANEMTCCYAAGAVNGSYYVGGLAGYSMGFITACYATGAVTGSSSTGGLMALNDGGSVAGSFWDVNTTGQATSDGGTGKTTAQMKTLATFTAAGWDFSAGDGDAADWQMPAASYPHLAWEIFCGDATHPYPSADINHDCHVNLADFAMMSMQWLDCTAPECD